jgi:hypothetical protein
MTFNIIKITSLYNRSFEYICDNIEDYNKYIKKNPDACELIGGINQQIKPVFDVDAYGIDPNIDNINADISRIFPNKDIYYAIRPARETKKGIKYSYRFYVSGVRISSFNLKELLIKFKLNENKIYDMSIYDDNKCLYTPLTTKKNNGKVPPLTPINCSIFDCCASYIQEDYEDWDIKFEKKESDVERFFNNIKDFHHHHRCNHRHYPYYSNIILPY